ncbi:hypothetical protein [Brunnivagina elsteri]|nr:hypothetical protein [Calothrix elsteri]
MQENPTNLLEFGDRLTFKTVATNTKPYQQKNWVYAEVAGYTNEHF